MRAVITLNLPGDVDTGDIAAYVDYKFAEVYPYRDYGANNGNPVDSTVWSEVDFAADLDELQANACRVGSCFRCGIAVTEQAEVIAADGEGRSDCPESADGMPHEIDAPDGWND